MVATGADLGLCLSGDSEGPRLVIMEPLNVAGPAKLGLDAVSMDLCFF